jgi:hypothetical protein
MLDNTGMNRSRPRPKKIIVLLIAIVALAAVWWVGTQITTAMARQHSSQAKPAASTPGARNDLRRAHLEQLATAMSRYITEVGPLPVKLPVTPTGICAGTGTTCKSTKNVDLMFLTSTNFITALPSDPSGGYERGSTGYQVSRDAESGQTITRTVQ